MRFWRWRHAFCLNKQGVLPWDCENDPSQAVAMEVERKASSHLLWKGIWFYLRLSGIQMRQYESRKVNWARLWSFLKASQGACPLSSRKQGMMKLSKRCEGRWQQVLPQIWVSLLSRALLLSHKNRGDHTSDEVCQHSLRPLLNMNWQHQCQNQSLVLAVFQQRYLWSF